MPSATGQNWEKYKKEFADDEEPEKKITPLTDEYVWRHKPGAEVRMAELNHGFLGIFKCSKPMAPLLTQLVLRG